MAVMLLLFFVTLLTRSGSADEEAQREKPPMTTLVLRDGVVVEGDVTEVVRGAHVTMRLLDGTQRTIDWNDIDRDASDALPDVPAPAPAPTPAPPRSPKRPGSWYGWQTLLVDAVATGLIVGGMTQTKGSFDASSTDFGGLQTAYAWRALSPFPEHRPAPLLDVGLALYTMGPPLVHALHGRPLTALGSLGVRGLGPSSGLLTGALVGLVVYLPLLIVDPGSTGGGLLPGGGPIAHGALDACLYAGALVGLVGPMFVDGIALAREPVEREAASPRARLLTPRISVTRGAMIVGVGGDL
jgi:hypothetical protein